MKIVDRWVIKGRGIVLGIDAMSATLVEGMRVRRIERGEAVEPTWRVVGIEAHADGRPAELLLSGEAALPEVGSEIEIVREPCAQCGAADAEFEPDPYAEEIKGDSTPGWICRRCYRENMRDI